MGQYHIFGERLFQQGKSLFSALVTSEFPSLLSCNHSLQEVANGCHYP